MSNTTPTNKPQRKRIAYGSQFEENIAYSRAVIDGQDIFVSGTTGYHYDTMQISCDVAEQTEQCFLNIERVLKDAGSGLSDIVRITYILPNKADFPSCWPVLQRYLGSVRPAATMIEAGLLDDKMKIEIQVTAKRLS